jgi:hypothetical protein
MAQPQSLLVRLLDTPNLPNIVPQLPAEVLHGIIQHCGLEDCAEFVALATPAQLARVLDADVWSAGAPGVDETFDAARFGLWLEVLMEAGVAVAIEKVAGLDIDLIVTGFSRHAWVFDQAVVAQHITLEGELAGGYALDRGRVAEVGGYVLEAKLESSWDAITQLLVELESAKPDVFHRVMLGCIDLSSPPAEESGFDDLLDDDEQHMFDVAADRETRREELGYLVPAQARSFLQSARKLRLEGDPPPPSPIARAYFRAMAPTPVAPRESSGGALPESSAESASTIDAGAISEVVELLREAGVLAAEPRALLTAGDGDRARFAWIDAYVESHEECAAELAYLANALIAGCSIQDRPFTVREAAEAVKAVCNLGLESWPAQWPDGDLVTAFQVGWSILHRDVCVHSATRLIEITTRIDTTRDIQLRLSGLRRALRNELREGTPWQARGALDVILMLDGPSWAVLGGLLGECPVTVHPTGFAFIARHSEIEAVHALLESLPSVLTG